MKYIVFNNKKVDTSLFIQLQDMASVLTGIQDIQFRFDYGHYLDKPNKVITASRFWDNLPIHEMEAGYKTDVFLRAIGTYYHTDPKAVEQYMKELEDIPLKKFGIQLFTLLEDTRLEDWCKRERPGTSRLFHMRRDIYLKYFESQLQVNDNRGYGLDSLFCMIFLTLLADTPEITFSYGSEQQMQHYKEVKFMLYNVFEAKNTADIALTAEQIVYRISGYYEKDSMNEYFILPLALSSLMEACSPFDSLKRKSKLKNNDQDDHQHKNNQDEVVKQLWKSLTDYSKLEISSSDPHNIEVNPLGISKATGLKRVCEHLKLHPKQVITMGDGINDIAMMKWSGLGIAMGNAQPEVKSAAGRVTDHYLQHGVAKAIESVLKNEWPDPHKLG